MKIKNMGDPFVCRLELRLTKSQSDYINGLSQSLDITPSQLIRMMIDSSIPDKASDICQCCIYKKGRLGM